MRIVIAGGTGLIGRSLVNSLVSDDHEVVILSRNPEKTRKLLPADVKMTQWDGKSIGDWVEFIENANVVVNFAGENLAGEGFFPDRWTKDKKRRIRESRLDSGRALVEAQKQLKQKPSIFLHSSAVGYYGARGDEIWFQQDGVTGFHEFFQSSKNLKLFFDGFGDFLPAVIGASSYCYERIWHGRGQ